MVVTWEEGHTSHYPNRLLRLACRCAGCREEMTDRALLDPEAVPADVYPASIELVGNYAIRIRWTDGHDTGIYTYEYLLSLCGCEKCLKARR